MSELTIRTPTTTYIVFVERILMWEMMVGLVELDPRLGLLNIKVMKMQKHLK